jgi:hypothetical protein
VADAEARLWIIPDSAADQDRQLLLDVLECEFGRITKYFSNRTRKRTCIDFFLYDSSAKVAITSGVNLEPGMGFTSIVPIWQRPYVTLMYQEPVEGGEGGVTSQLRHLLANETVKAYLLACMPLFAPLWCRTIGWLEEGLAAYMQGSDFDGHDLDIWAAAILVRGISIDVASLLATDFDLDSWREEDLLVFDVILIRQLGSFWRFWNAVSGIARFFSFYRENYSLFSRIRYKLHEGCPDSFHATYGVSLQDAASQWLNHLKSTEQSVPAEVSSIIDPAIAAIVASRWTDCLHHH